MLTLLMQEHCQPIKCKSGIRMFSSRIFLKYLKRSSIQWLSLLVFALCKLEHGQIGEATGNQRMLGSQLLRLSCESLQIQRFRLAELALNHVKNCQIIQYDRSNTILNSKVSLIDRECSRYKRFCF